MQVSKICKFQHGKNSFTNEYLLFIKLLVLCESKLGTERNQN